MGNFQIEGNLVPRSWYRTITMPNGKPDLISITLLSEIVYWYRPKRIYDEKTGELIGFQTKYYADLLQKSYGDLAETFNLSKRQVKASMDRLEGLGVIRREFRNVVFGGVLCNNVLYIELKPDMLDEITNKSSIDIQDNVTADTSCKGMLVPANVTPGTTNQETNTKNTTEITNREHPFSDMEEVRKRFKKQIEYEDLIHELRHGTTEVDAIVELVVEELTLPPSSKRINGHDVAWSSFVERMGMLTGEHIKYVINAVNEQHNPIKNPRAYLLSVIYNAPTTMESYYSNKAIQNLSKR